MFSRTAALDAKSQVVDAKSRARAGAIRAAGRARAAATQFTPLAKSAQLTLGRGAYGARVWAAPRIERTGVVIEERLAPRVSALMTETARRVQPTVLVARRRRWPAVAGIGLIAAGGAALAVLRMQRKSATSMEPGMSAPTPMPPPPGQPPASAEPGEPAHADVNGQVRTP